MFLVVQIDMLNIESFVPAAVEVKMKSLPRMVDIYKQGWRENLSQLVNN